MRVVSLDPSTITVAWALFIDGVLSGVGIGRPPQADIWVAETPQAYENHQDAHTNVKAMRTVLDTIRKRGGKWVAVKPFAWKGNVPKPIHHRRVAPLLSPVEGAVLAFPGTPGYNDDLWDAVALGLWYLRRTGRGGT